MTAMDTNRKLMVAFYERHQSLINDGYRDIITTCLPYGRYSKLRHPNGNYISLTAYYDGHRIVQRTNGIITHEETMC